MKIIEEKKEYNELFFSNAEYCVKAVKQEKATPIQWLKMLEKNGGIKIEEDKWLGLSEWLMQQRMSQPLTKQSVLDYIQVNKIKIHEIELTEEQINPARLEKTTQGLKNKRELVLSVPSIASWDADDNIHFGKQTNGKAIAWIRFGEIIDDSGKSILVIDEIQSKRHQYKRNNNDIPDAPFQKKWYELSMKRMLLYASERGYSKIAWTTGGQQANRYELIDEVSRIFYTPTGLEVYPGKIIIITKQGKPNIHNVESHNMLIKMVGKDIANKIANGTRDIIEDLDIGSKGIKDLYDVIIPHFMEKYSKKWKGTVYKTMIPNLTGAPEMWCVNITEEMKRSIIKGQAMFKNIDEDEKDTPKLFNEELHQQINNVLPIGHIYQLGHPSDILRSAGIPNLPIQLSAERLLAKSEQKNHPFDLCNVINLPSAVQNPIAVFDSKTQQDSKVILTELSNGEKNFIVAMRVQNKHVYGRRKMEINDIRSVYPKNSQQLEKWILDGDILKWIDKEKATNWLGKRQSDSTEVAIPNDSFNLLTKIIQNFENPSLKTGEIQGKIFELGGIFTQNIYVKKNRDELPEELTLKMKIDSRYPGLYDIKDGSIYLISNEIKSPIEVEKILLHEVLGHKGLRSLKKKNLNTFLDKIYPLIPLKEREEYMERFNGDKYLATEEYIAEQAENYQNPTKWEKIKSVFKSCLRDWGFKIPLSDGDLRTILSRGKKVLEKEFKQVTKRKNIYQKKGRVSL